MKKFKIKIRCLQPNVSILFFYNKYKTAALIQKKLSLALLKKEDEKNHNLIL